MSDNQGGSALLDMETALTRLRCITAVAHHLARGTDHVSLDAMDAIATSLADCHEELLAFWEMARAARSPALSG